MQGHTFLFGEFRLDVESQELWCGDARVELRSKCFDLLVFLLQRPGQLIRRETLFESLWSDVIVSDATLSRTMAELRDALGDDPALPRFIETIPRRGYKFVASVGAGTWETARKSASSPSWFLVHRDRQGLLSPGEHVWSDALPMSRCPSSHAASRGITRGSWPAPTP